MELPAWVSKTAVWELYGKNTGVHGRGNEDPETRAVKLQGQRPALVFRVGNLLLSELWEQSSQEDKKVLLQRIPQAVRQVTSLWEETVTERMRRPWAKKAYSDESQNRASKEPSAPAALTRPMSRIQEPFSETFLQTDRENVIVYAAKAPDSPGVRQSNEDIQVIHELESRISRQEYIIRQEQLEREELQKRMKKQESRENTRWKSGNIEITSKQGGTLSQNVLSQLQEQLRLERIRYGAD